MTWFGSSTVDTTYSGRAKEWASREMQLARLHEEILSRREVLLNCNAIYQRSQELHQHGTARGLNQAYQRNEKLLQDFRGLQERIYDELTKPPSPRFTTLEKNYWAMVKSQLPMWEHDMGLKRQKVQTQSSSAKQPAKGQQKMSQKTSKKKHSWLK